MSRVSLVVCLFVSIVYAMQWEQENEALNRGDWLQAIGFHNETIFIIGAYPWARIPLVTTSWKEYKQDMDEKDEVGIHGSGPTMYGTSVGQEDGDRKLLKEKGAWQAFEYNNFVCCF